MALLGRVATAAMLSVVMTSVAQACPLERLAQVMREPLDGYEMTEVAALKELPAEGASWRVYSRADGRPHSIIRHDYGETGQRESRISFIDRSSFSAVVTELTYEGTLGPRSPVVIAKRSEVAFLFCGADDQIFIPASPKDEAGAADLVRQAKRLRSLVVDSEEIAGYLDRLK